MFWLKDQCSELMLTIWTSLELAPRLNEVKFWPFHNTHVVNRNSKNQVKQGKNSADLFVSVPPGHL